jgi:hypothetical protein
MRFLRPALTILAVAVAVAASESAAMAAGYSGNWPVTVSHSFHSNGTYCLTLSESRSGHFRQSGSASLMSGSSKLPFGTFEVIDHILVATIQQQGGSQNAGLVFAATAGNGRIGTGFYEQVYGGEDFDSGTLVFGMKGGC